MMLSSSLPLITALLSKVFLNRKIKPHELAGILVIMLGTIIISIYTYFYSNSLSSDRSSNLTGIVLSLFSTLCFGFLTITEQISLEKYRLSGPLIAGSEGALAFFLSLLLLPVLSNANTNMKIDFPLFCSFVSNSESLRTSLLLLPLIDMVYTLMCILCTKHTSALTRSIVY